MAAVTTVVEGNIKFREGKKWKSRWCVVKKPSPVADHLQVVLYKNVYESAKPDGKCKSVFTLDSYFGLDASVSYDREPYVMAIICEKNVFLFAFEQREEMIQFEIKIRLSLGEEHHFLVKVVKAPSSSKIPKDQLSLIIHDTRFCLTAQSPPKILLFWNIIDLRRYGLRDGKFCFEGGTGCGKGSGLFALQSDQIETIADIIDFAATGKMSNCHRKFKNRSSQIDLGSHLIADIPSLPSQSPSSHLHHIHHSVAKGPLQGALPATLNCCHDNQTGSAESEDWNWYKRHSVSVMDYRRISALREKSGSESRDQLTMGIYDIPPNHDRKLDVAFPVVGRGHGYDHPRSFCVGSENAINNTVLSSTSGKHEYCNTLEPHPEDPESHYNKSVRENKNSSLREDSKESNSFLSDNEEESHSAPMSRNETLQKLKKQEYNIQKEMRLLDEMLLNCAPQNEEVPISACGSFPERSQSSNKMSKKAPRDSSFGNYDEVPMKLKEPVNLATQGLGAAHDEASSMNVVMTNNDFEIISGNISLGKTNLNYLQHDIHHKRSFRSSVQLNKTMPDETPISPLFHAKLNNIPSGSKLNAPLPYVNLSRYDDDSTSHVHLPGSADSLPVARGSSFSNLNSSRDNQSRGPIVWRQHSGSLSSLHTPVAASSLTNLSQFSEYARNKQNSQARFQLRQAIEGQSYASNDNHSEILVVNLEGKNESKVKHRGSLSKLVAEKNGNRGGRGESEIVNLLTTDVDHGKQDQNEAQSKSEGIYENLPVAREETPPPALPPKGPALLRRLRAATVNANDPESKFKHASPSPSTPHRQNKSFSSLHDSSFGYDTDNTVSEMSQKDLSTNDEGPPDENYLHMGSPKTSHKFAATVPMVLPNKKKFGSKYQVRDDYMDMGVIGIENNNAIENGPHEDEIYLDVEETLRSSTKGPPERRMSGKTVPLGLPPAGSGSSRESTYVEMATVTASTRKSMVIQNLETLQAYVSKKPGGEKGASSTQASPTTSQPPLPRPYKVRHNSDSGLSNRDSVDLDSISEKARTKSPMKIYTKVKSTDTVNKSVSDPPLPFQNLMDFTKKMPESRQTYVNTFIDAEKNTAIIDNEINRNIPLPEPVKEGFLARLKRRSSRDKGSPAPEKASTKNRSSILERSMSEHDSPRLNKEEKNSKLKIGRRRSSSFPNRLSYQEAHDDEPHAPVIKKIDSPSHSFSSISVKSKTSKRSSVNPADQSGSSSSVQDYSEDSDVSPLLKRGGRKIKANAVTVMHVQQNQPIEKNVYMHTSRSTSCLVSQIPHCSKTDDEKLSEILYKGSSKSQSMKKGSSFEDPSSLDLSMEKKYRIGLSGDNRTKFSHLTSCQEQKNATGNSSEYCLMDPPKPEAMKSLSVSVESDGDLLPPALPPKNRNYQNLLSPVLEAIPPTVPPRPYLGGVSQPADNISEDSILDQYVELSSSFGSQDKSTGQQAALDSKAGRLSDSSTCEEAVNDNHVCATITLPITHTSGYHSDIDSSDSPVLSIHSYNSEGRSTCTNPAKSVLRPRTGRDYAVVQRVPMPPTFRPDSPNLLASLSPTWSRIFNYDLDPERSSQENTLSRRDNPCHHDHPVSCDCTPKSQTSSLPRRMVQRTPSIVSHSDTLRSNSSLCHDHRDPQRSINNQNSRARLTSLSVSTLSSLSPSPKNDVPHYQFSPGYNTSDLSAKLTPVDAIPQADKVFFPDEISISTVSDVAQYDHNSVTDEDYHIYVNQEYVFMHQQLNSGKRTVNSISSHSSASPRPTDVHSCLSLFRDSAQSKLMLDATDKRRESRQRSRHSESDAARAKQISHSFGAGDRLQKSLTLPSGVHRSHSDPKRVFKTNPHPSHSRSHIHEEKYDKFAQSSIIARRRQLHAVSHPEQARQASTQEPKVGFNVFTTPPSLLQVPVIKSSGYKNIDSMKVFPGQGNDHLSQNSAHSDISPSSNVFESPLTPGFSDASYLSCNNSHTILTSTPTPTSKPSPSPTAITPPPLPPRKMSPSSTISSPLTPHTCGSDSPPPYRAPPPPLLPREASLPAPKDDSASSSSSEDEQELIYIEVDMTKRQDDVQRMPSVSLSRRSRRTRPQKELAKLRYAEIDHRATKALKETSEKLRDDRRTMGGSSINRKNSSFSSKNRKSSCQVSFERHLSNVSIESC